jgi:hypothetical protein
MSNLLKKIAIYGIIALGVIYGYRFLTGKSITTLPRDMVNKFYEKGPVESTNPKYYKDPAESLPKD